MGERKTHVTGHAKEKAFCRWGDVSITVIREARLGDSQQRRNTWNIWFSVSFYQGEQVLFSQGGHLQLGTVCQVDWNKLGLINNNKKFAPLAVINYIGNHVLIVPCLLRMTKMLGRSFKLKRWFMSGAAHMFGSIHAVWCDFNFPISFVCIYPCSCLSLAEPVLWKKAFPLKNVPGGLINKKC